MNCPPVFARIAAFHAPGVPSRAVLSLRINDRKGSHTMTDRITKGSLEIATVLHDLVVNEIIPGTGVDPAHFWAELENILAELAPKNKALLAKRDEIQTRIDAWHQARKGQAIDMAEYKTFLTEIGYLLPEGGDFAVTTDNVDAEIATVAGPQLVVPVMNARYALNAANARWGSLYDALYGTDAIPETEPGERSGGYNAKRGAKVIAWAREFLDASAPLDRASWADAKSFDIAMGRLAVMLRDGSLTGLIDGARLAGYRGEP